MSLSIPFDAAVAILADADHVLVDHPSYGLCFCTSRSYDDERNYVIHCQGVKDDLVIAKGSYAVWLNKYRQHLIIPAAGIAIRVVPLKMLPPTIEPPHASETD